MDNITHSLIGLAISDVALKHWNVENPKIRKATYWASFISNNLPDLDFIYAPLLTEGKLGYLLHHRGHTHTILGGGLQSLVILFFIKLILGSLNRSLYFVVLLGPLLHIFLDSLNSYGVHPFWPFNNHWYYLDAVFIVEPWLWVTIAPFLFHSFRNKIVKTIIFGILLASQVLVWVSGLVPQELCVFFNGASIAIVYFSRVKNTHFSILWLPSLVIAAFLGISHHVRHTIISLYPQTKFHDLVLAPSPTNPWYWKVLGVESQGSKYFVRSGHFSLLPLQGLKWDSQYEKSLTELQNLTKNCYFKAFLKFARVPYWKYNSSGQLVMGDFRYLRKNSFAEVTEKPHCPRSVPPWEKPFYSEKNIFLK